MKPFVSILVPAYNAEKTLAATLESALGQSWPSTEIIVVDDGSKDGTGRVAQRFTDRGVRLVTTPNQGAAGARNQALELSRGDYIQWLDADDLLAPDKIEKQLSALGPTDGPRVLLSGPWAPFYYRTEGARFIQNSLCQSQAPGEWLLHKMGENLHMQTGTWLTSRELTEAAGPWDARMVVDDDGEYYCRVLKSATMVRFVPEAKIYYRVSPSNRVSHIGLSNQKKDAMLLSMQLHVQSLRSMMRDDRVNEACLNYLKTWYPIFFPERTDLMAELQSLAGELGGHLDEPKLRWKYAWMKPLFGWKAAKRAEMSLPQWKAAFLRQYDKMMLKLGAGAGPVSESAPDA